MLFHTVQVDWLTCGVIDVLSYVFSNEQLYQDYKRLGAREKHGQGLFISQVSL